MSEHTKAVGAESKKGLDIDALLADVAGGVDAHIAEVRQAAEAAEQARRDGEASKKRKKANQAQTAVENISGLEDRLEARTGLTRSEDGQTYKWIMEGIAAALSEAPPKGYADHLEKLTQIEDALEKAGLIGKPSEDLARKIELLRQAKEQLFGKVKAVIKDGLKRLKAQHTAEGDALIEEVKQLVSGPLAAGVRVYDRANPAERMEALKQEVREFFLRPLVDGLIAPHERDLAQHEAMKRELAVLEEKSVHLDNQIVATTPRVTEKDLDALHRAFVAKWGDEFERGNVTLHRRYQGEPRETESLRRNNHRYLISVLRERVKEFPQRVHLEEDKGDIEHLRMATLANRLILDEVLDNLKASEEELRVALAELRHTIGYMVDAVKDSGKHLHGSAMQRMPDLKNPVAVTLLRSYLSFGVSVPFPSSIRKVNGHRSLVTPETGLYVDRRKELGPLFTNYPDDSFNGQIRGRAAHRAGDRVWPAVAMDREFDDFWRLGQIAAEFASGTELQGAEFERFASIVLQPNRKCVNAQLAYQRVLAEKEPNGHTQRYLNMLRKVGWKEAENGAWYAPGDDPLVAMREFDEALEALSQSRFTAETSFNAQDEEGRFVAYTMDQAVGLVRRAKRDAFTILAEAQRRTAATDEQLDRIEALESEKARLEVAARQERSEIEAEIKKAQDRAKSEAKRANGAEDELRIERREQKEFQGRVQTVVSTILAMKAGWGGGIDKAKVEEELKKITIDKR